MDSRAALHCDDSRGAGLFIVWARPVPLKPGEFQCFSDSAHAGRKFLKFPPRPTFQFRSGNSFVAAKWEAFQFLPFDEPKYGLVTEIGSLAKVTGG